MIRTVEEKEPGYIKEYIKNHIKNRKINELESTFLAQAIIMTGDAEFIDYCENSDVLNHETREILDRFTKMPTATDSRFVVEKPANTEKSAEVPETPAESAEKTEATDETTTEGEEVPVPCHSR